MRESMRARGAAGEEQAAQFLLGRGAQILARNFTVRGGEIDLIVREGAYLVFVEVKVRAGARCGVGREAVGREKQRRICRAAMRYVVDYGLTQSFIRFDVIEIQAGVLTHIPNAFAYQA